MVRYLILYRAQFWINFRQFWKELKSTNLVFRRACSLGTLMMKMYCWGLRFTLIDLFEASYWHGWTERLLIDCDGSWSIPPGGHVRPNVDLDSLYFNLVKYGSVTCKEEINLTHLVSGLWVSSFITSTVKGGKFNIADFANTTLSSHGNYLFWRPHTQHHKPSNKLSSRGGNY